jgi:integrase
LGEESYITRATEALGYDPFARWRRDSKSTMSFNARSVILQGFFKFHKTNAETLLILAGKTPSGKPQFAIEKMVEDYLDWRADPEQGYATSTVAKEAGIISGFFRANNVSIKTGRKYSLYRVYEGRRILAQKEVSSMIRFTKGKDRLNCLEKKAVICVEAQTAQRIGILPALKFGMIRRYPVKGKVYGVIEVMPEIADRNNHPVNKTRTPYSFGLHWQSMKLLDELKAQRKAKDDDFIWTIDKRRMQEAIFDAAKDAGIQKEKIRTLKPKKGKKKWKRYEIHPHVFRRYWMERMDKAGIKNKDLLHFQLGHDIKYLTYEHGWFEDEKIIAAINQADKYLRVLPSDRL